MEKVFLIFVVFLFIGCSLCGLDVQQLQKCPSTWDEYKKEVELRGWVNSCGYYIGNGMLAYDGIEKR
jgi:hypothetical protein